MIISTSQKKNNNNNKACTKPDKKEPSEKPTADDLNKFNKWINQKETGINYELFKKHFKISKA